MSSTVQLPRFKPCYLLLLFSIYLLRRLTLYYNYKNKQNKTNINSKLFRKHHTDSRTANKRKDSTSLQPRVKTEDRGHDHHHPSIHEWLLIHYKINTERERGCIGSGGRRRWNGRPCVEGKGQGDDREMAATRGGGRSAARCRRRLLDALSGSMEQRARRHWVGSVQPRRRPPLPTRSPPISPFSLFRLRTAPPWNHSYFLFKYKQIIMR